MGSISLPKLFVFIFFFLKLIILSFYYLTFDFPDPFLIYGHDESFMHMQSKDLMASFSENGIILTILNSSKIIGSYNTTWPLIMAAILSIYNHVILIMILKALIFSISTFYLFKIAYLITQSRKSAWFALIFITFYPPMNVYLFSIFRDDLIFSILAISFYLSLEYQSSRKMKNLIFSSILILITLPLRIHVGFIMFLVLLYSIMNKRNFLRVSISLSIIYLLTISFVNSFLYIGYYYIIESFSVISFNPFTIFFDLAKFILGPLPWQIVEGHHMYSYYWYYLKIFMIILSFYLFPIEIFKSVKRNFIYLSIFFIYFFAYYISHHFVDALGPRQFALIAPFLFIFIYGDIIKKLRF